ncbi:DUF192 domain-containing protein [Candidatus Wolfebacteria bacterium]|nr:DUF192 domain-containing protein [Candidatus Wolfebacteria bacterium]
MKQFEFGIFFILIFIALAIFLFLIFFIFHFSKSSLNNKAQVNIGSLEIPVEVVKDSISRAKGLSGRQSLDAESGMLFIFKKAGFYSFWMPDMNFPIDIIWINNGKVVDITSDIPNEFNILNPKNYKPSFPAQYVLEVNAGFAKKKNIKIGDLVSIIGV